MEKEFALVPDYDKPVFELDVVDVPQCQINTLMDALLHGAKAFYARPGAEEQFQEWLKKRKETHTTGAARAKGHAVDAIDHMKGEKHESRKNTSGIGDGA